MIGHVNDKLIKSTQPIGLSRVIETAHSTYKLYFNEDITQQEEYKTFNFGVESSNLSILTICQLSLIGKAAKYGSSP